MLVLKLTIFLSVEFGHVYNVALKQGDEIISAEVLAVLRKGGCAQSLPETLGAVPGPLPRDYRIRLCLFAGALQSIQEISSAIRPVQASRCRLFTFTK